MTTADFGLTDAVPLAHALLDQVAREQGVRVLFIKGPMAALQGLRSVRSSIDVDALVDPARRAVLASALSRLGWVDEHPYTSPTVLPQHSLTHRHPHWPCELDLHDRFPGFFRNRQEVFEALWARRTTVVVAGREVPCPDRAAQSVILALHSLRDPHDPQKQRELAELVELLRPTLDVAATQELAELADELGAADTAAPFLADLGAPPVGVGTTSAADLVVWRLRTEPDDTTAVSWVDELRRLPLRARPKYLWYAATLTDRELRIENPTLPPGRLPLLRARAHRLRRGLPALPGAFRNVRSLRQDRAMAGPARRADSDETRIVVVTLMRREGVTGVQTHIQALAHYLGTVDHGVRVVTPFSSWSPLLYLLFGLRYPLRWVNRPLGVWWYNYWHAHYLSSALRRQLRRLGDDAVLYAQCPVSAGVALRLRTTQPVVMVEHFNISQADEWVEKGDIPRGGRVYRVIRRNEERVLPALDGVVYVSEFAKRELFSRIPALAVSRSAVIPNFVPGPEVGGRHERRGDLITVGTLEPRKNQSYLLDVLGVAAARGRAYSLDIIGSGPDRARLEAQAVALGISERVRFLGHQPQARRLMPGHALYVHAARLENLPLVILEAMACGLPVLSASVGGIPEMVRSGVEGDFWPLDDPEAAADVLIRLMDDPQGRDTLGSSARRRVAERYTSDVVVPRLESFLLGTIDAGAAPVLSDRRR